MNRYAQKTNVSVEKSKFELDKLLGAHGATRRGVMADDTAGSAVVAFCLDGRPIRIEVTLPTAESLEADALNGRPPRGWKSWTDHKRQSWCKKEAVQQRKQRWRALVLLTKAKLETISDGLSTVEGEFLAHLVMPSGKRLLEEATPALVAALEGEQAPLFSIGELVKGAA